MSTTQSHLSLLLRPNGAGSVRCPCCLMVYERDEPECEALAKAWAPFAAAGAVHAALVSAMSNIPNPDDPEDTRADALDEYGKFWCRAMHKTAREAFEMAKG